MTIMLYIKALLGLKKPFKFLRHKDFRRDLHIYADCHESYFELMNKVNART